MLKHILLLLAIFLCLFHLNSGAQIITIKPDSSRMNKRVFYKTIAFESAYFTGAMLILQNTWYKGRKIVPFHFYNDNEGYLNVDKFGHGFGAYIESYIGYQSLLNAGVSKNKALFYGGSLGFILQMPIEIMDGIHEGWGFSWGDMAANALGSGLVIGQELVFREQIVKYKFSYWESNDSRISNGYLGATSLSRFLKDYNGHTYWFSMPVNKLISNNRIPRWLNIALGYGANGMFGEYENITSYHGVDIPETVRYRQYLLSLDIDWTQIKTRSKFLKVVLQGMTFVKMPFPALEYNSKGKLKGYWMYY